jgi:hypothetical protein
MRPRCRRAVRPSRKRDVQGRETGERSGDLPEGLEVKDERGPSSPQGGSMLQEINAPWSPRSTSHGIEILGADGRLVAFVPISLDDAARDIRSSQVVAAAPELQEALLGLLEASDRLSAVLWGKIVPGAQEAFQGLQGAIRAARDVRSRLALLRSTSDAPET